MARLRVAGKPLEREDADAKGNDLEVTLKMRPSNNPKEVRFFGLETGLLGKDEFQLIFKDVYDKKRDLLRAIAPNAIDFMSVEDFITLLKHVGVKENIAEEVGRKIEQSHFSVTVAQDGVVLHVPVAEKVFAENPTPLPTKQEPEGKHSARVLQERQGTGPIETDGAAIPATWDEAKAAVPGLRKWVEVKREAGLTSRREGFDQEVYDLLLTHLRDNQTGLGKWATSKDGMPRNLLRRVDSGLLQELYSLGNSGLPPDISLPHGKPTGRPQGAFDQEKRVFAARPNRQPRVEAPTYEQLREARRIAKLGQRRGVREG